MLLLSGNILVKKRKIRNNIRRTFPTMDPTSIDALTDRIVGNLGRHVADIVFMSRYKTGSKGATISVNPVGSSIFESQEAAIYVGAHVGCWELAPLVFARHARPLTVIYSKDKNPYVDRFLMSARRVTGATYVQKETGLRPCMHALQQGGSIALLVDQRTDEGGIAVDFFGQSSQISRLPARLAIKYGCPIVPFEVVRVAPNEARMEFKDPIRPQRVGGHCSEQELSQQVATAIEASIRRNLDTWFCNKRRWEPDSRVTRTRP